MLTPSSRNEAAIQKADALAKAHGVKATAYKANGISPTKSQAVKQVDLTHSEVSDWTQVQNVVAEVAKDFGRIDVFVANAGTSPPSVSARTLLMLNFSRHGKLQAYPRDEPR